MSEGSWYFKGVFIFGFGMISISRVDWAKDKCNGQEKSRRGMTIKSMQCLNGIEHAFFGNFFIRLSGIFLPAISDLFFNWHETIPVICIKDICSIKEVMWIS